MSQFYSLKKFAVFIYFQSRFFSFACFPLAATFAHFGGNSCSGCFPFCCMLFKCCKLLVISLFFHAPRVIVYFIYLSTLFAKTFSLYSFISSTNKQQLVECTTFQLLASERTSDICLVHRSHLRCRIFVKHANQLFGF